MLNWFRGWDCKSMKADRDAINKSRVQSCKSLPVFLQGPKEKNTFFINSPSYTAIPQAQIEQGERARERLREGEWEQRFDKDGGSLISVLHTLLDDQSRKCCFNSKNHISQAHYRELCCRTEKKRRRGEEEGRKKASPKSSVLHCT